MSYDFEEFEKHGYSELEVEALQEISNIGVGHSATALSQLLHRRVDMSVPLVELVKNENLAEKLVGASDSIVSSVLVQTADTNDKEKTLNFLIVFNEKSTRNIINILRNSNSPDDLRDLDEIALSIVKETGNILLLHTITAINTFTGSTWFPNVPELKIDMIGSITEEIISTNSIKNGMFLLVECDVFSDEENLKGVILIIPNDSGMKVILEKIYGEDLESYGE
ncbi:MAG: chemotaxis protein CheC [Candidatus Heimdallarchaeota archaeon]|nr:chemotaxis protein CheC [Candidatus Heimdallarchaeota archaeon]MDH5647271.1 chemotaxis protein CheC [Candidatus Heimdallarchaeota archaeon]